eukprot:TRINITY_DN42554_c0_g1_i1.p1 TRINITY_DN42554_c0_g1~~TRINITY_DN42554_c0_g1_i1.p1  ORF type:complete len:423 (-),score=111.40 TRINITY_DN42554_c0_g1_i1:159-1427(-)
MANRTNFVKVCNLPPGYSDAREMFSLFSSCGQVQDMTAVEATTVIVSFSMRSGAENSSFALSGATIGGNPVTVTPYFNMSDPQFYSNPVYQRLGQYIGQDQHVMDPNTFQPWGAASVAPMVAQPHQPVIRPPTLTLPNYNLGPGFGSMFQALGSFVGGGAGPSQPVVPPPVQPTPSASNGVPTDILSQYTTPWAAPPTHLADQPQCSICLSDLSDTSSYDTDSTLAPVLSLSHCKHAFHSACLTALMSNSPSPFLQCPTCKKVYGIRTGTRPTTGTMTHRLMRSSVPGHGDCGTIELHFMFSPGIQGPEHPHPGHYYTPVGFPRTAFLPDNNEGLKALHGLYLAWEQRLLFTVGRSITTGQDNCVTWNDIHLKTKTSGGEHSYPDDQYLTNLGQDLAGFGITEAEISSHMGTHTGLRQNGRL